MLWSHIEEFKGIIPTVLRIRNCWTVALLCSGNLIVKLIVFYSIKKTVFSRFFLQ